MKESFKVNLTNWFIIIFVLIILGTSGLGFLFQNPIIENSDFEQYRLLLTKEDIHNIKSIEFRNKMGNFTIHQHQDGWKITTPQTLLVKDKLIDQLFSALENMKIARIFNNELINRSNFSLETPQVEIKLATNTKKKSFRFGIINPIDNSTYLLANHDDVIYNVNVLDFPISSISLSDLIEDRAFPINLEHITELTLIKNIREKWILTLQNGRWIDIRGREYKTEKVNDFLRGLSSIPSIAILGDINEKQQKKIHVATNPFGIEIHLKQGQNEYQYFISNLINNFPDIKTDKKTTFLISSSQIDGKHLVAREYFNQVVISPESLRK